MAYDTLIIELSAYDAPEQLLIGGLRSCTNLSMLVLLVPGSFPAGLLSGVQLPALDTFKTNMKHGILVKFISNHPYLQNLDLQAACRHPRRCPLGRHLGSISELVCDAACIPALPHRVRLIHLTVLNRTGRISREAQLQIWRKIASRLRSVHTLNVQSCRGAWDIISAICGRSQNLKHLRIVEASVSSLSVSR